MTGNVSDSIRGDDATPLGVICADQLPDWATVLTRATVAPLPVHGDSAVSKVGLLLYAPPQVTRREEAPCQAWVEDRARAVEASLPTAQPLVSVSNEPLVM